MFYIILGPQTLKQLTIITLFYRKNVPHTITIFCVPTNIIKFCSNIFVYFLYLIGMLTLLYPLLYGLMLFCDFVFTLFIQLYFNLFNCFCLFYNEKVFIYSTLFKNNKEYYYNYIIITI